MYNIFYQHTVDSSGYMKALQILAVGAIYFNPILSTWYRDSWVLLQNVASRNVNVT
jgi:hypothetical protein